jgi:hypothetical protein
VDHLRVHHDDSEHEQDMAEGEKSYLDSRHGNGTGTVKTTENLAHYRMAVDAVKAMKAGGPVGRGSSPGSPSKSSASASPGDGNLNNELVMTFARSQLERRHTPASVDMWTAMESDVRPSTGVGRYNNSRGGTGSSKDSSRSSSRGAGNTVGKSRDSSDLDDYKELRPSSSALSLLRPSTAAAAINQRPIFSNIVHVCAFSSWGDPSCFGVTGIAAMDAKLQEFTLPCPDVFIGEVKDDVRGGEETVIVRISDPVTTCPPENIINGLNLTTDANFMWRSSKPEHLNSKKKNIALIFQFEFDRTVELKGLRLWNYNAGREESCCGVKHVNIYVDNKLRCSTVVRKGPGEHLGKFDFSQFLSLVGTSSSDSASNALLSRSVRNGGAGPGVGGSGSSSMHDLRSPVRDQHFSQGAGVVKGRGSADARDNEGSRGERGGSRRVDDSPDDHGLDTCDVASESSTSVVFNDTICRVSQQYETPVNPTGCMVKIVIRSTHGDPHYVGLNGIALFDSAGEQIAISPDQLQATPSRYATDDG